ncbi:MAG: hypothetical protein V1652_02040 [bacterium]
MISEKIYKEIQNKGISPTPRWKFLMRRSIIWLFFCTTVIISGIAVGVLIFLFVDFDWAAHRYLHPSLVEATFLSLPYFWFMIIGIFFGVAYYNFRHTRTGYRYQVCPVVFIGIAACLIVGGISYILGAGEGIDSIFMASIPYYQYIVIHKKDVWMHPDKGLLSGVIRELHADTQFELEDFKGNLWLVHYPEIEAEGSFVIEKGDEVKVIGEWINDIIFIAREIRPWDGRGFRIEQATALHQ